MKLTGNTILITGGSAGIGLAFAKKFTELGNDVIITGRNQARLDDAVKQEPRLHALQSDAGDPEAIVALAARVQREFPNLNVLMNNAGVFQNRNVAEPLSASDELNEIAINIGGPIRMVAAFINQLKVNRGTIINVSSGLAYVPLNSAPVYCATKAAVHSYTVSLRLQLAEHGVEVVELMPPLIKTDMTSEFDGAKGFTQLSTGDLVKATVQGLKKGKKEIRPGQSAALHIMSRVAPGFITGELAKAGRPFIPQAADS